MMRLLALVVALGAATAAAATCSKRDMSAGSGGGGLISRQPRRSRLSSSTVIPIDLWTWNASNLASPSSRAMRSPLAMFARISSAIVQCSTIATVE